MYKYFNTISKRTTCAEFDGSQKPTTTIYFVNKVFEKIFLAL